MSDPNRPANEAAAFRQAKKLVAATLDNLSDTGKVAVVQAVVGDLLMTPGPEAPHAERIDKLEAQTHVLSEAIIAITDQSASVAPAVKAVKDEM